MLHRPLCNILPEDITYLRRLYWCFDETWRRVCFGNPVRTLYVVAYYTARWRSCGAVYCNRPCLFVCMFVCLCVCYHNSSKLYTLILTKLALQVKNIVFISSWWNFGRPAPPGRGSAAGRKFWLRLTTASAQCLRLLRAIFRLACCARCSLK